MKKDRNTAVKRGKAKSESRLSISPAKRASPRKDNAASQATDEGFRAIFDSVPVSIWVEDFSKVKKTIDELCSQGVTDFRKYLEDNPSFVRNAARQVKVIDVNQHTLKLFKAKSKNELIGNLNKFLSQRALVAFKEELIAIAERKPQIEGELDDETMQGQPLSLWRTTVYPTSPREFNRVLVCLIDISEQKKNEEALRLNEDRLRQIIDLVPHFIFAKDEEGKFTLVNQAVADAYGTSVDELTGKTDADFAKSDDEVKHFRADDMAVIDSGKPKSILEETITDSSGAIRVLNTTKIPFTFSGTSSRSILGVSVDITERRQAEDKLRESERRIITVLEASPVPLSLNSMEEGIILYGNSALAVILGVPLNELIGQKTAVFYANPDDRRLFLTELEQKSGSLRDHEVQLRRADGSLFWVSLSSERILLDGQTCLLSAFSDITERKRSETIQSAIYQISEAANKSSNLGELFQSVHAIIGRVMPARNFYIALYDEANELLSFPYYVDEMENTVSIPPAKPGRGMTEYVLRWGKPLLSDAANFEELARLGEVELVGPPSPIWIGAPLVVDGRTIGVIALQDYHDPKVYSERELKVLEYVSDQVAKAIERTRLHEGISQNNRMLIALQKATLPLLKQMELSEMLQAILVQATELFNTSDGYIYLASPDETEIVLSMGIGPSRNLIGTRMKVGEGMAGKVIQTKQPMIVNDYSAWSERLKVYENNGVVSYADVPLFSKSKIIGVLGVGGMAHDQKFEQEDVEFLTRFAGLVSIAIENSRLYTLSQQELAERKITEEALREAEAKYRTVVERISAITYTSLLNDEKTLLYVSPQVEPLLGYTQKEYLSDSNLWKNTLHPQDRERVIAEARHFYETGEPFVSDYKSIARNGRVVWFHDEAVIYEDASTHKRYIQGIKVDITQRMQAEALQKAIYRISDATSSSVGMDVFYREVHDALRDIMIADNFYIALYDRETDLLSFPYYVDQYDTTPATAPIGSGPTSYVIRHGVSLFGKSEIMQKLEEEGTLMPAGTKSIDWLGVPLKIRNETIGAMAIQTYNEGIRYAQRDLDILAFVSTQVASSIERKQAEIALKASEEKYRELYQNNPLMLFTLKMDGTVIAVNEETIRRLEYSQEELVGHSVLSVFHPEDRVVAWKTMREFVESLVQELPWEFRTVTKNGRVIWVAETSRIISDVEGGYAILIVCEDITERKRAEEALQASESRYRLSARATNDVIWEWDILTNEKVWSENLHHLFGYPREAVPKNSFWWEDHVHVQDSQRVLEKMTNALLNEESIWEDEYRFMRHDGSVAYIIDRGYIERDLNGKPVRMIGAMSDITDRKRREDELEALATVGAALRVAATRDDILKIVLDQIISQFGARGAVLTLRKIGTDDLVVEAAEGEWSPYLGMKAPISGGVSRHVMESGKPYVNNDLEKGSLINLNGMGHGSGSFISAPLSTPSGMIGAVNIGRSLPFMAEDIRLVMNIADMAANAIQRVSAYEQLKRQVDHIKVLRTIDQFIASGAEVHLTLQSIVNHAITHLGVDAACILTLNPSTHVLEFSEGAGFRSLAVAQTSLRVGEGFAGQVVLKREMIVEKNLAANENHPLYSSEGIVCYYGVPLIAKGDVKGVLEIFHRSPLDVDRDWLDFLESLAAQAALAIDNATLFHKLQRSNMELGMAYESTLEGWSAALDLRDKETEGHTQRVTNLTLKLAEFMGVADKERIQMRRGALLHDIGKMGIPDRILLKPDVLTGEEWEIMRQHPVYAYNLLHPITHLRAALDIPYCHHEKWDGSGYPRGLKAETIPLAARIFAVADVWDALSSDRPYRPAWAKETALSYIKSLSGVHFDPQVVEVFLRVVGER